MRSASDSPDVLHLDMDCFFAAVEVREDPSLRGRPVIVGGAENRGVVAAASYEARSFGVRSAMSIREAQRRCPDGVFLPPRHGFYQHVSDELMEICKAATPFVEPLSLDEAFLGVAGAHRLLGDSVSIAHSLRDEVRARLQLRCSVGVGRTKLVAKLASRAAKPRIGPPGSGPIEGDGVFVVGIDDELEFLQAHTVRAIPGIGPQTAESLAKIGIQYVSELASVPLAQLERRFGRTRGLALHDVALGIDDRIVSADRDVKSIGQEITFGHDLDDGLQLSSTLRAQSEEVMRRCRANTVGGRTVTLKVRYGDFTTITRSRTEKNQFLSASALSRAADALFDALDVRRGIRLIGIAVSNLEPVAENGRQLDLFGGDEEDQTASDERRAEVEQATDEIRRRFGPKAIGLGAASNRGGMGSR